MKPPVTGELPEQLKCTAAAVSTRLAEALHQPLPAEVDLHFGPDSPRWRAQSLSKGAAGVAVLHGLRAQAGLGGRARAHAWLRAATREPLSAGPGAGLWYGAPAVGFAIAAAAPDRYGLVMRQLDLAVVKLVRARLADARARRAAAVRPALSEFDLVRGLAGLCAYLLRRDPASLELRQVLDYLIHLTRPLPACDDAGTGVPGWWTGDIPSGASPEVFGGGHSDLGMAHGIVGVVAALALAMRAGVTVAGHAEAIARIASWLEAWRQDGPAGPWWPERVTLAELRTGRVTQDGPRRPSWCYGTPGIARALQLAGIALGDHARQERAEDALSRCLSDPAQLGRLTGPAVCHGWAGLLATGWHAAADARSDTLAGHMPHLLQVLLDCTPTSCPANGKPGLVDGNAGIAATLHSLATGTDGWQTCLLIN